MRDAFDTEGLCVTAKSRDASSGEDALLEQFHAFVRNYCVKGKRPWSDSENET